MAKLAQTKGPSSPVLLLFFPQGLLVATIEDGAAQTYMTFPFNAFTASKRFQLWGFSELDVYLSTSPWWLFLPFSSPE